MKKTIEEIKAELNKPIYREFNLVREDLDEDKREIPLAFSSESPYERYFGLEVLDHSPASVRLGRLNDGGALLLNHDTDKQIGVVEFAKVDIDKKGRAVVRFSKSALGEEIYNDVKDKIRTKVSVGYMVHDMVLEESKDDGLDTYRVRDWEPLEISIVSVPADSSVGVNRELEVENKIQTIKIKGVTKMDEKTNEQVLAEERARLKEIEALASQHSARVVDMVKMRDSAIQAGTSVELFKGIVLNSITDGKPLETKSTMNFSEKEKKEYSFLRAIQAQIPNSNVNAPFEREVSAELEKRYGAKPKGIYVPDDTFKRDMTVGSGTAGGTLVSTDVQSGGFIDMLRGKMLISKLGGQMLTGLTGSVSIPRQTAASTAYWVTEGSILTEATQMTLGAVSLTPKHVGVWNDYSRQLMLQSNPSIENLVKNDIVEVLAREIDAKVYYGTGGSGTPAGIITGATSVVTGAAISNGGTVTWAMMLTHESNVATANADIGTLAFVTTPAVRAILKGKQKVATYGNDFICNNTPGSIGGSEINGYPCYATSQAPAGFLTFGKWDATIIAQWGGLDVLVDPYSQSSYGNIHIVGFLACDVGIRYPGGFSVSYGVTA